MSCPLAAAVFLTLLAAAGLPHARGTCGETYEVMRGDTLYSIARLCRSDVAAIARASGLADPRRIEVGQRLVIPGRRARALRAGDGGRGENALGHRMARGDTLYSLARRSRVSLNALLAANPGVDPRRIEIGDLIRLPAGAVPVHRARERRPPPFRPAPPPPAPEDQEDKPADEHEPEPEGM